MELSAGRGATVPFSDEAARNGCGRWLRLLDGAFEPHHSTLANGPNRCDSDHALEGTTDHQ